MAGIHPDTTKIMEFLATEGKGQPPISELTPAEARERMAKFLQFWNEDAPPIAKIIDRTIAGPHGPIPLRIYDPGSAVPSPGLVFFHGGGFVLGSIATHEGVCRRLANYSGCRVVSVDYRLAPEYKFPIPLDDCVASTRWVAEHGAEIGVDSSRLFVSGESAGASLALATTLVLRDEGGPALRGAALIYGCYDIDFDTASYQSFGAGEYLLSKQDMVWFWDQYLRDSPDRESPRALLLRARLAGLPPLLVIAAEFDPLLDDSHRLAERLRAAGAPHDWLLWPGVIHGCILMTRMLGPAEGFLHDIASWVNRHALPVEESKSAETR